MQASVPAAPEETVWRGSPSLWLHFGTFVLSAVVAIVLIAGAVYLQSTPSRNLPDFLRDGKGTASIALAVLLAVPAFFALRRYIITRSIRYQITTERVLVTTGIFSKKTDNLELYRVDDLEVAQPFLLRLVGRGNVAARTSDRTTPTLVLSALPDPLALRDRMRKYVEACRDRKRTRVLDMSGGDSVV